MKPINNTVSALLHFGLIWLSALMLLLLSACEKEQVSEGPKWTGSFEGKYVYHHEGIENGFDSTGTPYTRPFVDHWEKDTVVELTWRENPTTETETVLEIRQAISFSLDTASTRVIVSDDCFKGTYPDGYGWEILEVYLLKNGKEIAISYELDGENSDRLITFSGMRQ